MNNIPYREVITPQIAKLFSKVTPDTILQVPDSHAFVYSSQTGILVDPDTCQTHTAWCQQDPQADHILMNLPTGTTVSGRYCTFYGIPMAAFWRFQNNGSLMRPAARSLLGILPRGAVAVLLTAIPGSTGGYSLGDNEVVLLGELAGRPSAPTRGHQYWQLRQTSEDIVPRSVLWESWLPTRPVLDPDLHQLLDSITPDQLLWDAADVMSFVYTEQGELIWFRGEYGHEDWLAYNRPDLLENEYNDEWHKHMLAGRFGRIHIKNNYYSKYNEHILPVLSIWAYKRENRKVVHLLMPALRALIPKIPPDTLVTCGAGDQGAFAPFPLSMLTGQRKSGRGHQYWQRRQTSESRIHSGL